MPQPALTLEESVAAPAANGRTRYEDDVYTWALEQAALLRSEQVGLLDLVNIAEELCGVSLSECYRLQSAIEVILIHMLKWDHQPERRSRSWALSIATHRERIAIYLRKSPGLKSSLDEAQENAFRLARTEAAKQMRRTVKSLPADCPYGRDELLNRPISLDGED